MSRNIFPLCTTVSCSWRSSCNWPLTRRNNSTYTGVSVVLWCGVVWCGVVWCCIYRFTQTAFEFGIIELMKVLILGCLMKAFDGIEGSLCMVLHGGVVSERRGEIQLQAWQYYWKIKIQSTNEKSRLILSYLVWYWLGCQMRKMKTNKCSNRPHYLLLHQSWELQANYLKPLKWKYEKRDIKKGKIKNTLNRMCLAAAYSFSDWALIIAGKGRTASVTCERDDAILTLLSLLEVESLT